MRQPLYISFHTPDYAEVARRLEESARALRLTLRSEVLQPCGPWCDNTRMKPAFILRVLEEENRPVVWVDADAVFRSRPTAFDKIKADIGACRVPWPDGRRVDILSGTVYVARTQRASEMLRTWRALCRDAWQTGDQPCMERAIDSTPGLRLHCLPVSHCFIFDTHRKQFPGVEPVIEHFQESRKRNR